MNFEVQRYLTIEVVKNNIDISDSVVEFHQE